MSGTIFKERLQAATQWLKDNKLKGVIGEFAAGDNDVCMQALKGGLGYMTENSDVWLGAIWWAAGPWWGDVSYLSILLMLVWYADLDASTSSTWSRRRLHRRGRRSCRRLRGISSS